MREIKFRQYVWDDVTKKSGRMYGWEDLLNDEGESLNCVFNTQFPDASPLMQYTGLKDSKCTMEYPEGQEIYEGDVLRERPDAIFQVIWDEKWAKFKLLCIGHYEYPEWNRGVQMKVIGNIYENPELLEGGA